MQIVAISIVVVLVIALAVYCYLYYPQQSMPIGEPIDVKTPEPEKYHDDCLHPCIRYCASTGKYYMAQSPYYGWNNAIENPMYYESDDYMNWQTGTLIADTPDKGFNTDPCIYVDKSGHVTYIWRECKSELTYLLGSERVIVGGQIEKGRLAKKQVFAVNEWKDGDTVQCPILIEHNGENYMYAAWYQYEPVRKNRGISIWRESAQDAKGGGRMFRYQFVGSIPFGSCCTVDKYAQVRMFNHNFYFPKPLYHDMWHFDLFEYADKLYMVSVAEKGDNIMLSVADDWVHFKTFHKPLVNNHYTENYSGYRQYYYKPTAFVKDDILHVFYTVNAKEDRNRNQLYHTQIPVKSILR